MMFKFCVGILLFDLILALWCCLVVAKQTDEKMEELKNKIEK